MKPMIEKTNPNGTKIFSNRGSSSSLYQEDLGAFFLSTTHLLYWLEKEPDFVYEETYAEKEQ